MKLLDPFLVQYIKEPQGDVHELFFQSLQRLITVKNVDYYHKYLNRAATRGKSPDAARFKNPKMKHLLLESHKLHPQVEMQTLLREFKDCPTGTLIILITRMLQLLINLNDHNVPPAISSPMTADNNQESPARKNKLLTRYHSRTPPAIWIDTYISRLVKFNNFTQANLLLTIYYIDLLSHNFQPYFTLNSWTVHRFLLVATMLAQKALEDFFYTNEHYAKVAGVALTELNCLELDFLSRVNWRVVPAKQLEDGTWSIKHSKEVLDMYYWQLVTLTGKNVTERNNVMYVFGDESPAYASRL
ncbi:cyclin-domain-containing protein [Metschnikowia bicuspidata]|uniref:Cyclin-domain-containing protein n=1 Tax=Metschnikowia bicuspidata TaxID=27322 RepID=A0A4V1J358_9ASCO|nr:cyclin-domain-containing protein [Metschnikowia bicuspidata]